MDNSKSYFTYFKSQYLVFVEKLRAFKQN